MAKLSIVETAQLSFNYELVAQPVALRAREAAERIKLRLRRSAEDIIEIGRDLIAVKESIGHGNFLPWIEAEFRMSESAATKFMQVARVYGKSVTVTDLSPTALYELAAPKTPFEVREEVEKMIEAGEVVTKATVVELRNRLSAAENAKALAENELAEKDTRLATLEQTEDERVAAGIAEAAKRIEQGHAAELARLTSQIQALSRPKLVEIDAAGKVVPLHRELTDDEKAAIDAEGDDLTEIVDVSSPDRDRAAVVVGSLRSISRMKAGAGTVLTLLTEGYSKRTAAEHIAMLDAVISFLQSVKDQHNG